ncbi:MAG: hypothetical protein WBD13_16630 [Burkholderiaceae bacterium]
MRQAPRRRKAEDIDVERGTCCRVLYVHDGVVQADCHGISARSARDIDVNYWPWHPLNRLRFATVIERCP